MSASAWAVQKLNTLSGMVPSAMPAVTAPMSRAAAPETETKRQQPPATHTHQIQKVPEESVQYFTTRKDQTSNFHHLNLNDSTTALADNFAISLALPSNKHTGVVTDKSGWVPIELQPEFSILNTNTLAVQYYLQKALPSKRKPQ
jgi:hypothetical protein